MITPREMLRDYMTILNILMQNPDTAFSSLLATSVGEEKASTVESATSADGTPRRQYEIDEISF